MDPVLLSVRDGIARVTLNRPEKRNALNAELISTLHRVLDETAKNEAVHVVVIAGAGKDFCAGLDLLALDKGKQAGPLEHIETARQLADVFLTIRKHPRPIIAAVHGRALGGGAGLATACDLIVATQTAALGYPEIKIGFVPAIVAPLLRRSISEKRVFELFATAENISALDAQVIGLINQVFPDDQFEASVTAYAQNIAAKSSSALSLTKTLLLHTDGLALEKAIEAGVHMNALTRMTEDAQRGFEQFLKKG